MPTVPTLSKQQPILSKTMAKVDQSFHHGVASGGKERPMRIATGSDAATLLAPLFAASSEERVAVLHLGSEQEVLALTLEHRGTEDEVELPVRAILAHALRLGSHAIIVAHNHPSGNPFPSEEDMAGTRRLAEAAAPLGLKLFDHLIFAGGDWRSFRALGLL